MKFPAGFLAIALVLASGAAFAQEAASQLHGYTVLQNNAATASQLQGYAVLGGQPNISQLQGYAVLTPSLNVSQLQTYAVLKSIPGGKKLIMGWP